MVDFDAEGSSQFIETMKEPLNVLQGEEEVGVVDERARTGSWNVGKLLAGDEFFVDFAEEEGQDNSGKTSTEGAALGKAFALFEVAARASVGVAPTPVWFFVHLVKARNHVLEFRCGGKEEAACVATDFVERVGDTWKQQTGRARLVVCADVGCRRADGVELVLCAQ